MFKAWTNKQIRVHALCNSQWNITISEDSTITKAHSLCKQCLHKLHFFEKGILLTKPFQAVILWKQNPCAELFTQWMDFNLFMTSKNPKPRIQQFTNLKRCRKAKEPFKTLINGIISYFKKKYALLFHIKGFKRHFAAL